MEPPPDPVQSGESCDLYKVDRQEMKYKLMKNNGDDGDACVGGYKRYKQGSERLEGNFR